MGNLVINIATKNGTGSLSANQLLAKIFFRAGWTPGSCNFFPSNIAGLPCLYSLRLNSEGWAAFSERADVLLSLNPKSLRDDLQALDENSLLVSDEKDKIAAFLTDDKSFVGPPGGERPLVPALERAYPHPAGLRACATAAPGLEGVDQTSKIPPKTEIPAPVFEGTHLSLPFTQALREIEGLRPKTRSLFKNMIYVGLFCEWLKVDDKLVQKSTADFFGKSKGAWLVEKNLQAVAIGRRLACGHTFPFPLPGKPPNIKTVGRPLSRGKLDSPCLSPSGFFEKLQPSPSSSAKASAPDSPSAKAHTLAPDSPKAGGKAQTPQQALASGNDSILIDGNSAAALGALFAGCQFASWYPITPASSLAENFEAFAHLFQKDEKGRKKFFVLQAEDEIGGICQALGAGWAGLRAMTVTSGPGLSLMSETAGLSYFAEIPLVLCNVQRAGPSTGLPTRTRQGDLLSACFLSHGDSKHVVLLPGTPEESFYLTAMAFDLAEKLNSLVIVLSDLDLAMNLRVSPAFACLSQSLQRGRVLREKTLAQQGFQPYGDEKGDGISFRSLPGLSHSERADFTRGSGHNTKGEYSERPEDCAGKLEKLERKWQTAKKLVPQPVVRQSLGAGTAFVTFGPNEQAIGEFMEDLSKQGVPSAFMRILAFPFSQEVGGFLKNYDEIFVVEQNRDGQMKHILCGEFPQFASKMRSLLQYDGRPLTVENLHREYRRACKD